MIRRLCLLLSATSLLAACGGEARIASEDILSIEQRAACSESPAKTIEYGSEAELQALLVGRWARCADPQFPGEDVGVEFTSDHRWFTLTRDTKGSVSRVGGVDDEGTWEYLPVGTVDPYFGVLTSDAFRFGTGPEPGGGVTTDPPVLLDGPAQMRVNYSPVLSVYVPL